MKKVKATITLDYSNNTEFVKLYLSLFYKQSNLTEREYNVLVCIVENYLELDGKVEEPYLTELILSTDRRKDIQTKLNLDESNFNNLLKSIKDKGLFGPNKNSLLPLLYPKNEIIFSFNKLNNKLEKRDLTVPSVNITKEKEEQEEIIINDSSDLNTVNSNKVEFDGTEFNHAEFEKLTANLN